MQPKVSENSFPRINNYRNKDFQYFLFKDTFKLTVVRFYKNDVLCNTHGIPYALIIGKTEPKSNLPEKMSILAMCDNNIYKVGQVLVVKPINNPESDNLRKISFRDQTTQILTGVEYPATWANIIKVFN